MRNARASEQQEKYFVLATSWLLQMLLMANVIQTALKRAYPRR